MNCLVRNSYAKAGLAAALCMFTAACRLVESGARNQIEGQKKMISLELRLNQHEFAVQEAINVELRIVNAGAIAVDLPDPEKSASTQPLHILNGPAFPGGKKFSQHSLALEAGHGVAPAVGTAPQIRLEPGGVWEGTVPLSQLLDLGSPGEYTFRSVVQMASLTAESAPVSFQILPAKASSVHLGTGTRPLGNGEGEIAFLQSGGNTTRLLAARFSEGRPDIGELDLAAPLHRMNVGANATDVSVPWRNSPFFNEMFRWIVWREGATVHAASSAGRQSVSVALGEEPAGLVRPSLRTTGGPVEVFALSKDGRQLSLISFETKVPGSASGKVGWTSALPQKPLAITAALAPGGPQARRHIAFAAQAEDGALSVYHASLSAGGPISEFREARLAAQRWLGDGALGMYVDKAGDAVVGVIGGSRDQPRTCVVTELRFPAEGGLPKEIFGITLPGLDAEPERASLLYVENQGIFQRRESVIVDARKQLFRLRNTALVPVSVPGIPTVPILLAPGESFTYILYLSPERGYYFEPI